MQESGKVSLTQLMWWSVRLAWARNKGSRRRFRQLIWAGLEWRWKTYVPDMAPGSETAVVQAVWLGASLAARSLVRYPLLPPKPKQRLIWLVRLAGKNNGKALVSAYLAWTWLREAALAPTEVSDGHLGS